MLTRRGFMGVTVATTLSLPAAAAGPNEIVEQTSGDPDAPIETSVYPAFTRVVDDVQGFGITNVDPVVKAKAALAAEMLRVARDYAAKNYGVRDNAAEVEQWLELFGIRPRDANGKLLAFCASGLCWSACQAYANLAPKLPITSANRFDIYQGVLRVLDKLYFYPNCSVTKMRDRAIARSMWRPIGSATPKPGWAIVYDWKHVGHADHIGLFRQVDGDTFKTVEFNTRLDGGGDQSSGGHVADRTRNPKDVLGFISWY